MRTSLALLALTLSMALSVQIAGGVLGISGLQPYLHKNKHPVRRPNSNNHPPFLINEITKAYNAQSLGVTGAQPEDRHPYRHLSEHDQNTSSTLQVHDNADLSAPRYIHLKVTRP